MKLAPRSFLASGHRGTPVASPLVLRAGWRALKLIAPLHPERPATLALVSNRSTPDTPLIKVALDACATHGISAALTQALRPEEFAPFLAAGGTLMQELFVLNLCAPRARSRWERPVSGDMVRHWPDEHIAELDYHAFGGFWHFDTFALADALAATPASRLRAIMVDGQPVGYLICGANDSRGFVQRLAVHPDYEGRGYASALLRDGLGWLGRRGVHMVTINTQLDNIRAKDLYERHGFVLDTERLGVIGFHVGAP